MTNYLAAELRQILDDLGDDPLAGIAIQRLRRLAEHVDRVAAEPDVHELAVAGLDPEQEIRARALDAAARLLAPLLSHMSLSGAQASIDGIAAMWLHLAESGAELVRDGSRPTADGCICPQIDVTPAPGYPAVDRETVPGMPNPRCPEHGERSRP